MCFTVWDWQEDRERVLREYDSLTWKQSVAVRSSALMEDTAAESFAGKYESFLNVCGRENFMLAAEKVIDSYEDGDTANQVLVQPMLNQKNLWAGVAFTVDPNTLGNYYVINYSMTGSTSEITSGSNVENILYYQFKGAEDENSPAEMQKLCKALQELEQFFGQENLDVEFAFADNHLYILQVRSLCIKEPPASLSRQKQELCRIRKKIWQEQMPKPFLCGQKTVYSVMTDWNPAEMIGIRPKPLALSLYQEIITDSVWAYQRDNYGYRNLRSFPLMVTFAGLPYIDVRVSFNSFIPADLEEELSEKLVNYYIGRLTDNPLKHDKAEFEIVFSCYTLDISERIQILKNYGFTETEIQKILHALRNVMNHIIDHKNGLWRKDYEKIQLLDKRYHEIMGSGLDDIGKVYWLLEDCKRYGTLPFAGLARGAFIAVQILQSLVSCGIFSKSDYELFMNEVSTVSSEMNADMKELSRNAFLEKYGHLRPGTYDIASLRYDEAPELYFDWEKQEHMHNQPDKAAENNADIFRLSLTQLNDLKKKLDENGLANDILELMDFMKTVIEGREYGKFVFTRNLSRAIQLIAQIGETEGISKEDCAFMNIRVIYELYASAMDVKESMLYSIRKGRHACEVTNSITLPPVITSPDEVMHFFYPDSEPNFITTGKTSGPVYLLETMAMHTSNDLEGKIILIPCADPGYDWIFSHKILGFLTMYGGANSHMAIRAGELGIPAVVGVGEKQFLQYKQAVYLEIDAQAKTVKILR